MNFCIFFVQLIYETHWKMLKILVVEDDKFIAAIFSFFIKDLGYILIGRCKSGNEALDICERERPDVVIMDIHLEGELDGIQTAERLQRDYEIPVIFVSSDTSSHIVERAIVANSYGYLVKPVQKKELGITIDLAYYKNKVNLDQKRREQSFRLFISDAPIPMVVIVDKRIQYLNMKALDLFHSHYIEDIIGLPFVDFIGIDSVPYFESIFGEKPRIGRRIEQFDASFKGLHGKEIDVLVNGSWIRFNNRDALHLILSDISAEKLALNEVVVLKEILKEGYGAIIELNGDFEVTVCNKAFESLVDFTGGFVGKSFFDITEIKTDREKFTKSIIEMEGSPFSLDMETSEVLLKCRVYPLAICDGKPNQIIISVSEVIPNH